MALTLSDSDLDHLRATLGVLVSPFAYPDLPSWGTAALEACSAYLGADQAVFGIMREDSMVLFPYGERMEEASLAYMSYYWRHDLVVTERRFQLARETYHRDMLYRSGEMATCPVYNEWSRPNHLCDTLGISVEGANPLLAGMHFYHDTESGAFRERGVDLLNLILPAFKAGAYSWLEMLKRHQDLAQFYENFGDGVLLADAAGMIVHESARLASSLAADPEAASIRRAMRQAAAASRVVDIDRHDRDMVAVSGQHAAHTLQTSTALYQILTTRVPERVLDAKPVIAVVLRRQDRRMVPDTELRERFRLTTRELEVARLVAEGLRNEQIAARLGVSPHTALHHTESVLRKVGVHSRAAVAAAVLAPARFDGREPLK